MEYTIGQVSKTVGLPTPTLRYYETALELGGEAAVRALPEERVPKRHRAARAYLHAFD